jgi:hypothetical protein
VHGLAFKAVAGAPLIHPTVQVYEVSRGDEVIGVIYFDLFNRPGKAHGSYQTQYREAEHFRGRVLPISAVVSTFPAPPDMDQGQPVLLPWEYANVFFHEFGHALHMLHCTSAYRSLGSQHVAWDFVELPALIDGGDTTYGGRWVVNPSGGLISKGHPLGATGLAQCSELTWQLRGTADARQVDHVTAALQHNIGLGGAAVVTAYQRAQR